MVMFFGQSNSPATFQQFMNDSFRDLFAKGWLVIYMDNFLIFSANDATHTEWTKWVLAWMKELKLHLQLAKCKFNAREVDYLGMIIWQGEIAMDPVKLDGIAKWPIPTTVKEVHSFLGFANFYHQFIPNYSSIARPLIDLTKKDLHWTWESSQQKAFKQLKALFLSKLVFWFSNIMKPFAIATNASLHATKGILLQTDTNGDWHPCFYLSQSFSPAEQNYNIYDWELLAVFWGLQGWHHYLQSSHFPIQVFTNHQNLTHFWKPQHLNHQQARWLPDLTNYNLKMIHIQGSILTGPDIHFQQSDHLPLSGLDNEGVTLLPLSPFINVIDAALNDHIKSCSKNKPFLLTALQAIDGFIPPPFCSCLADWQCDIGILT